MVRELETENDNDLYQFLNLLKSSFPHSRYQFLEETDIKFYVHLIKKMQGFILVYGDPIHGTCQSRLLKHYFNNVVLDIVQIGGMCVKPSARGQKIATKLNYAIREKYLNNSAHDFAIFANQNGAGYNHAIKCGFKEVHSWSKRSIRISKNDVSKGINYGLIPPIRKQQSAFLFKPDELNDFIELKIFGQDPYTLNRGKCLYLMNKENNKMKCLGKLYRFENFIAISPSDDLKTDDRGNLECIIEGPKNFKNKNISLLTLKKENDKWEFATSVPRLATF